jgi:hypothetical protein
LLIPLLDSKPFFQGSTTNEEESMPKVSAFYSINEVKKPSTLRVHHDNSSCPPGRDIPSWERKQGAGNYRLCDDCIELNRQGR